MDKELAQKINIGLNTHKSVEALIDYAKYRIEHHQKELEQTTDTVSIFRLQGSIAELRRLMRIRDHAMSVSEKEMK